MQPVSVAGKKPLLLPFLSKRYLVTFAATVAAGSGSADGSTVPDAVITYGAPPSALRTDSAPQDIPPPATQRPAVNLSAALLAK